MNELENRNIPIAVFTNGPEKHQMKKFSALNLERWVPPARIFISENIGCPKPYAEAFAHVQESLNATPGELLFIGDTYETDIIGGQDAGWTTLWYNHRRKQEDEKMEKVKINTEYIKLDQFLKWVNVVGQGSDAKELIMDGFVKVNGEVEFRRGKKLVIGDIVEVEKAKFEII